MPKIAVTNSGQFLVGGAQILDTTGGGNVTIAGKKVATVGDRIAPHGKGGHANAVMVEGSGGITAGGTAICLEGDHASCGHAIEASGDWNVTGT